MPQRKHRLRGRWAAIVIGFLLIAAPAAAAVVTQNFLRADVTAAAACFVKAEGQDAIDFSVAANEPYADVDTTATIVSASGVTLLQERVTVTGYDGDRVVYSDVVRYTNNCDHSFSLELVAEADPVGSGPLAGDWSDKAVELWVSNTLTSDRPSTASADWEASPIKVDKGDVTPTDSRTGGVTLVVPAGSSVQTGFVIEIDDGATGTTGTLYFTAEATAIP